MSPEMQWCVVLVSHLCPVDEMDGDVVDGDGTGHNEEA
jgi:hypothetical protein